MAWRDHIPGFRRRGPLRAGVLNTGELVLVDDTGHTQIFTPATTDLIRDTLDKDDGSVFGTLELAAGSSPLPPVDKGGLVHEFNDHP